MPTLQHDDGGNGDNNTTTPTPTTPGARINNNNTPILGTQSSPRRPKTPSSATATPQYHHHHKSPVAMRYRRHSLSLAHPKRRHSYSRGAYGRDPRVNNKNNNNRRSARNHQRSARGELVSQHNNNNRKDDSLGFGSTATNGYTHNNNSIVTDDSDSIFHDDDSIPTEEEENSSTYQDAHLRNSGTLPPRTPHSARYSTLSTTNQSHYSKRPQSSYLTSASSRNALFSLKPSSFISSTEVSPVTREINQVVGRWVTENRGLDVGIHDEDEDGAINDDVLLLQQPEATYLWKKKQVAKSASTASLLTDDRKNLDADIDKLLKKRGESGSSHVRMEPKAGTAASGAASQSASAAAKRGKSMGHKSTTGALVQKAGKPRGTKTHKPKKAPSRQSIEQRIEEIRSDTMAKKRLMNRLAEHEQTLKKQRKQKRLQAKSIKSYVHQVSSEEYNYENIQRKRMENLRRKSEHHQEVLSTYDQQQWQLRSHLEQVWEEGVRKREYAEFKRATLPILKRNEKRQKMWYPSVVLAATVSRWCQIMMEKRIEREYLRKRERAKTILKKYLLPQVYERRAQRREEAIEVIRSNMLLWTLGHRVRKKRHSVKVIVSCIGSLQDSNRFSKQVAIFLHHVKTSQRAIKKHLEKRDSQLAILTKYWERVEVDFLEKQRLSDLEEYREKLTMDVEQLLATIEGNSLSPTKAHSVKQSMKKTKVVVIQSKKILKKAVEAVLKKEEIKKQLHANANILLEKLRARDKDILPEKNLDDLGRILSAFKRERFPVLPEIRDVLILQDIVKRSSEHRKFVATELRKREQEREVRPVRDRMDDSDENGDSSNNGSKNAADSDSQAHRDDPLYFKLIPSDRSLYEALIVKGQQLSKEEAQRRADQEAAEAEEKARLKAEQEEQDGEDGNDASETASKKGAASNGNKASGGSKKKSQSSKSRPSSAKSKSSQGSVLLDKKVAQMSRSKSKKPESPRLKR